MYTHTQLLFPDSHSESDSQSSISSRACMDVVCVIDITVPEELSHRKRALEEIIQACSLVHAKFHLIEVGLSTYYPLIHTCCMSSLNTLNHEWWHGEKSSKWWCVEKKCFNFSFFSGRYLHGIFFLKQNNILGSYTNLNRLLISFFTCLT